MAFLVMATCDGGSTTTTAVGGSGSLRRSSRMAGLELHFGNGLAVTTTDATAAASRRSHRW